MNITKNSSVCLIILAILLSINGIVVNAEKKSFPPTDFGKPISTNTYLENGVLVSEKIYFVEDISFSSTFTSRSTTKSGWYKNERSHTWSDGTVMKYYAQGYFRCADGKVSVSSASGGVNNVPAKVTISNKSVTSGTGKYGLLSKKYAYAQYTFTATNYIGNKTNFKAIIKVNEDGDIISQ